MLGGVFFFFLFPFLRPPLELSEAVPLEDTEVALALRLAALASILASDAVDTVVVLVDVSSAESGVGMVGPSRLSRKDR